MTNNDYEIEIPYTGITVGEMQIFSEAICDADRKCVIIKIRGD